MSSQHMTTEYRNDEISLQDLFSALWKQKWLILIITLASLFASSAYIASKKPVYEVQVQVSPPTPADIQSLNVARSASVFSPLKPVPVDIIYQYFISTLTSNSVKQEFYTQIYLPLLTKYQKGNLSHPTNFAQFLQTLNVNEQPLSRFLISVRMNDGAMAYEVMNQYLAFIDKKAKSKLESALDIEAKTEAKYIRQQMDMAIKIAGETKSGLLKRGIVMAQAKKNNAAFMSDSGNYRADRNLVLTEPNLQKLEAQYHLYNNIHILEDTYKMFQFESLPVLPERPIPLRWHLMFVFALLGGLFLGVMVAFIRENFFKLI